jgi:hypothetical protein
MSDAREARFDIVIVEALDRLSRDQGDLAALHKRLTFDRVAIEAVHDGRADAIQVGIRGLVSTLFLADLKHKTRRGLAGVIAEGRSAGGRAYGYRPEPGRPGVLAIVDVEADAVRRIFSEFVSGKTPRDIAFGLNRDGIMAPRGTVWNASSIGGSAQRANGILRNELYVGRLVWNRVCMVRDPDTNRRISRVNPESEWKTVSVPHLAIVDAETFEAAASRKLSRARKGVSVARNRRILSGLLRCHKCGGKLSSHDKYRGRQRYRCSMNTESGTCPNGRRYFVDGIERKVLAVVRERLADKQSIAEYARAFDEERRAMASESNVASLRHEVADATARIERLLAAMSRGNIMVEDAEQMIQSLAARRADATAALEASPVQMKIDYGNIMKYVNSIDVLAARMHDAEASVVETFRAAISRVVVHDGENGDCDAMIEIVGNMTAIGGMEVAGGRSFAIPHEISFGIFDVRGAA